MTGRRKNKHPKRAENVKTVVVVTKTSGGVREEEGEDEDVERLRRMLMCVPCGVEQNHQMRKEETAIIAKGVKRKRGQHECDVCGKVFGYASGLAIHMRIHTNEMFECDVSQKRFTQSSNLKVHMRIYTNEKPYECDVCEKRFRHSSHLTRHMRIHTNEKPYECDMCEKRFRESGSLKSHMRIHTNEKPYECDVCKKRYRHSGSLKYHMRTQH